MDRASLDAVSWPVDKRGGGCRWCMSVCVRAGEADGGRTESGPGAGPALARSGHQLLRACPATLRSPSLLLKCEGVSRRSAGWASLDSVTPPHHRDSAKGATQ